MSQSGGTAQTYFSNAYTTTGTVDLNPADEPGKNVYTGNYIVVRVNKGLKQVVTSAQYTKLVQAGYDVDVCKDE
jgi:hypothetical protein